MSETVTLGKRRKDGTWIVLVQPDRPFGDHLDTYRKISNKHPVNEEYVRVVMGKLHHSSPALNLITTEEMAAKVKRDQARQESIDKIVGSADARQQKQIDEVSELKKIEHEEAIAEKNSMIAQIRKDTKQATASLPPPKLTVPDK
jgi:hypothetical protein